MQKYDRSSGCSSFTRRGHLRRALPPQSRVTLHCWNASPPTPLGIRTCERCPPGACTRPGFRSRGSASSTNRRYIRCTWQTGAAAVRMTRLGRGATAAGGLRGCRQRTALDSARPCQPSGRDVRQGGHSFPHHAPSPPHQLSGAARTCVVPNGLPPTHVTHFSAHARRGSQDAPKATVIAARAPHMRDSGGARGALPSPAGKLWVAAAARGCPTRGRARSARARAFLQPPAEQVARDSVPVPQRFAQAGAPLRMQRSLVRSQSGHAARDLAHFELHRVARQRDQGVLLSAGRSLRDGLACAQAEADQAWAREQGVSARNAFQRACAPGRGRASPPAARTVPAQRCNMRARHRVGLLHELLQEGRGACHLPRSLRARRMGVGGVRCEVGRSRSGARLLLLLLLGGRTRTKWRLMRPR